jgi:hypothetical protein
VSELLLAVIILRDIDIEDVIILEIERYKQMFIGLLLLSIGLLETSCYSHNPFYYYYYFYYYYIYLYITVLLEIQL